MSQKIAIAVIHGIGKANPQFADKTSDKFTSGIASKLRGQFARQLKGVVDKPELELEVEAIYWAHIVQDLEDELDRRLKIPKTTNAFFGLRDFIFHSLADSIAYQITSSTATRDRHIYDGIHRCFAEALKRLADRAGERAPLCMIAHSMGSAIASNYFWDLQSERIPSGAQANSLETGETLALFYTFGSQIPFWSLRHENFGTPIDVPSPKLSTHYPGMTGEWVNFYDRDDLLGYPIQNINEHYNATVRDQEVRVGSLLSSWNLFSHNAYWTSDQVTTPIAQSLARVWKQVNGVT